MQGEKMAGEEMSVRQRAIVQFPFKGEIPASDRYTLTTSKFIWRRLHVR